MISPVRCACLSSPPLLFCCCCSALTLPAELAGPESKAAIEKGLASGTWFVPQIERKTLRRLMQRDDYHALRDTAILFGARCCCWWCCCWCCYCCWWW